MLYKYSYAFGLVIILFLIVLLYNAYSAQKLTTNMLEGMWIADENFCKDADIDGMFIYIGFPDDKCQAYIIMHSNNAVIINKKISFSYSGSMLNYIIPQSYNFKGSIQIHESTKKSDEIEEIDDITFTDIMPLNMEVELNISNGQMIWSKKDTVYAKLFKDNIATDLGDIL